MGKFVSSLLPLAGVACALLVGHGKNPEDAPMIVESVIGKIASVGIPVPLGAVPQLFPAAERSRIARSSSRNDEWFNGLKWTSASGSCFMYFLSDNGNSSVTRTWAKCKIAAPDRAPSIAQKWAAAFVGDRKTVAGATESGITEYYVSDHNNVGMNVGVQSDNGATLAVIELRSGVTPGMFR